MRSKIIVVVMIFVLLLLPSCSWERLPAEPELPNEESWSSLEEGLAFFRTSLAAVNALTGGAVADDSINILTENPGRYIYKYYYLYQDGKWERKAFTGASASYSNWIIAPKSIIIKGVPKDSETYLAFYSCSSRDCKEGWKIHELAIPLGTGQNVVIENPETKDSPVEEAPLKPTPASLPKAPRPSSGGGGSSSDGASISTECDDNSDCSLFYSCSVGKCVADILATPPEVFNTNFYQSPVHADPRDLLLIPGYNFSRGAIAVYKNVSDNPGALAVPASIPSTNTSTQGRLHVGSITNDSITVLLPTEMIANKTYAIWVKNTDSNWSEAVLINDPRPLWVTPTLVYATQQYATLPRQIKVVGRNLGNTGEGKPRIVRLNSATASYNLTVSGDDGDPDTRIDYYVVKAPLPSTLTTGLYTLQFSRNNETWINLSNDANLTVIADPSKTRYFVNATTYGGCNASDNKDDVGCIVNAIGNASAAGGGEIFFPNGTWNLTPDPAELVTKYGIYLHPNVDLVGSGRENTTLLHSQAWDVGVSSANISIFTVMGNNIIRDLKFATQGFDITPASVPSYLEFGKSPGENTSSDPYETANVTIYNCNFTDFYQGMTTFGLPIKNLFIVNNHFDQLYDDAIDFSGDRNQRAIRFKVDDAVVVNNTFFPGNFSNPSTGEGSIATQLSGAKRLDFSDNIANGTVNGGWRATHFWASLGSNERVLVANNKVSCTGEKAGDGEALVIDANQNTAGFATMENVTSAASNTVTTTGNLLIWTLDYYLSHNIYIADGKGIGQVRKIINYTNETNPTFVVSPDWDVIPDNTSKVMIHKVGWQFYMLDNIIDIRNASGCAKSSPRQPPQEGQISFQAATSDSVMDGNDLYDTNGIYLPSNVRTNDTTVLYSNEIKYNLVQNEYFYPASSGGINLVFQSSITNPVSGYNMLISHNTVNGSDTLNSVTQSDATPRAAVALLPQGGSSSTPYEWKNTLIFQNIFDNTSRGVYIVRNYSWNTVLYNNSVLNTKKSRYVVDYGTNSSYCGNYKIEMFEACDQGIFQNCTYGQTSCQVCSSQCTGLVAGNASFCGDNACDLKSESTTVCPQDCGSACPVEGLLDWWRAENNADDQINARDATINRSINFSVGKVGSAFGFDGVDDFILADAGTSYNFTSGLTFMAWVNPTNIGSEDVDRTILGVGNGNSLGYVWLLDGPGNKTEFFLGGTTSGQNALRQSNYPIPFDDWTHLAVTWNTTAGFIAYMNGTQVNTGATTLPSAQWGGVTTAAFAFGVARTISPLSFFNGSIDELAIWNRALNSSEILAVYNASTRGMCNQSFFN